VWHVASFDALQTKASLGKATHSTENEGKRLLNRKLIFAIKREL
jgi:hypothetical protein